jgi:hypothetical protein
MSGVGKSTLLQKIAIDSAANVIAKPKEASIPVFMPPTYTFESGLVEVAWREVSKYYKVKRKVFDKWLSSRRLEVFIDGINESRNPKNLLFEIAAFRKSYPEIVIIASSRPILLSKFSSEINMIGLPVVEMPVPTVEELHQFYFKGKKNS